ncbi:tumor suppressor candidate 3 [Xylographa carneopallida]|nr:tumor suppressor candidate 3 [Xylographa carneopallida]
MTLLGRRLLGWLLVVAILCLLCVSIEADSSSSSSVDDDDASTADSRLERKHRKASVADRRDARLMDRTQAKSAQSRALATKLRSERAEREKRVKREQERLKKKHEEELKRQADNEDPRQREEAQEKVDYLHQLTAKTSSRVLSLDDAAYKKYVLEGNRPYYVLVTFTALSTGAQCPMCHDFQRAKAMTAAQYHDDHPTTASYTTQQPPIFFVNIDAAKNRELFEAMRLNTAPTSVLLPPRLASKPLKLATVVSGASGKQKFSLQQRNHPHDVVLFVHKNTGQMITINYNAVNGEEVVIGVLAAACALFVLYRYFDQIVAFRTNPNIRFFLCLVGWLLYMWCISGGMYNIIKGNIFAHAEKDKPTEYISPEGRDQYGAEGLILGFLNIAASFTLVLLNLRAFEGKGASSGWSVKGAVGQLWTAIAPVLRPELCVMLMLFFCNKHSTDTTPHSTTPRTVDWFNSCSNSFLWLLPPLVVSQGSTW